MISLSPQFSWRKRSVHEFLGGGTVADIMLWRKRDVTAGILLGMLASWIVFQKTGYTVVSFAGSILLLLISILFVWARAAAILGRPPPSIPEFQLSEETVKVASEFIHSHVNVVLSAWHDITHGRNGKLFYKAAAFLWLISTFGSRTDFLTLGYTSLLIILTIPALYERYEKYVDDFLIMSYGEALRLYDFNTACFKVIRKSALEMRKQWLLEVEQLR